MMIHAVAPIATAAASPATVINNIFLISFWAFVVTMVYFRWLQR
jgi:hypothetical protein